MSASELEPLDPRDPNQQRPDQLQAARDRANELPCHEPIELAGRPNVFYELRDYAQPNKVEGAKAARTDVPYLFKSFETGQARPPRPGTKNAQLPRAATIHEYLDWTVTAQGSHALDELVCCCSLTPSSESQAIPVHTLPSCRTLAASGLLSFCRVGVHIGQRQVSFSRITPKILLSLELQKILGQL